MGRIEADHKELKVDRLMCELLTLRRMRFYQVEVTDAIFGLQRFKDFCLITCTICFNRNKFIQSFPDIFCDPLPHEKAVIKNGNDIIDPPLSHSCSFAFDGQPELPPCRVS